MGKKKISVDENSVISTDDLRRFASVLSVSGHVFSEIAAWLEARGITEFQGTGMPTARLGCRYLGNFVSTVLNEYHAALLETKSQGLAPEVISSGTQARALARAVFEAGQAVEIADTAERAQDVVADATAAAEKRTKKARKR